MTYPPILTGFNGPAVKWSVLALAGIALLLAAYSHGRHVRAGELAEVERDTALAYAREIVARQAIADRLAADNAALRQATATRNTQITREITRYVTTANPDRCPLPGTFRLLHDAAATGQPADPGALAAASADPVADTALLATLGDNYTACRDAIAQVEAWQRRYHAIEAPHAKAD